MKPLEKHLERLDARIAKITAQAEERLRPLRDERRRIVHALEILNAGGSEPPVCEPPAAGEASASPAHQTAEQNKVASLSVVRKDDAPPAFLKRAD